MISGGGGGGGGLGGGEGGFGGGWARPIPDLIHYLRKIRAIVDCLIFFWRHLACFKCIVTHPLVLQGAIQWWHAHHQESLFIFSEQAS